MSLCDKCYAPGQCCKNIRVYGGPNGEMVFWLDEPIGPQLQKYRGLPVYDEPNGLIPFEIGKVLERWVDEKSGRPYGTISFQCPQLGDDGRCTIYESRPWLCWHFEPRGGEICVHQHATEGADEIDLIKLMEEKV